MICQYLYCTIRWTFFVESQVHVKYVISDDQSFIYTEGKYFENWHYFYKPVR